MSLRESERGKGWPPWAFVWSSVSTTVLHPAVPAQGEALAEGSCQGRVLRHRGWSRLRPPGAAVFPGLEVLTREAPSAPAVMPAVGPAVRLSFPLLPVLAPWPVSLGLLSPCNQVRPVSYHKPLSVYLFKTSPPVCC